MPFTESARPAPPPAAAADPGSGCTDWDFIDEIWTKHNNGEIDLSRTLTRSLDNVPKKHRGKWARCVEVAADALRDADEGQRLREAKFQSKVGDTALGAILMLASSPTRKSHCAGPRSIARTIRTE